MITVTECARQELASLLVSYRAEDWEALRLLPSPHSKFLLMLDNELSGDQVVQYQGLRVLFVGIEYYHALNGAILDCQEIEDGVILFLAWEQGDL